MNDEHYRAMVNIIMRRFFPTKFCDVGEIQHNETIRECYDSLFLFLQFLHRAFLSEEKKKGVV
jgi:hypothetical protein